MLFKKRRLKKNHVPLKKRIMNIMFSSGALPILTCVFLIMISLLVIRMKSIDTEYAMNESQKEVSELKQENKEYKAKLASVLSVESLRKMAVDNDLNPPAQNQIIVIPE